MQGPFRAAPIHLVVATSRGALVVDAGRASPRAGSGLGDVTPTCLAVGPRGVRVYLGTREAGLFASEDGGRSWRSAGLPDVHITSLSVSPTDSARVWAGTEPSAVWRSDDAATSWLPTSPLDELPSSSSWAFPPRPHTHHVRWIACHPRNEDCLWVAVEAGALLRTGDGGTTWADRVEEGPFDTHELAVHPRAPERLRVAAGDGYFESADGGDSWAQPERGLEVRYLRSVAIDPGNPDLVVVSAASHAHSAYVNGRSDGRIYRRVGEEPWTRITVGWPDVPDTIAPLLRPGLAPGELWAADERGIHRSGDGGLTWGEVAGFDSPPHYLTGLAVLPEALS